MTNEGPGNSNRFSLPGWVLAAGVAVAILAAVLLARAVLDREGPAAGTVAPESSRMTAVTDSGTVIQSTTPTQMGSPEDAPAITTARPARTPAAQATPGQSLTPASQATEDRLLQQIAERICPYPSRADAIDPYERYFRTGERIHIFTCYPAAGHSITVTVRRFGDAAEAQAEFESAPAPGPASEPHGIPTSDWLEQHPSFPGGRFEYRVRLLRTGPFLIEIRSFDDTHFLIAPEPREVSDAVLQMVREHELQPSLEEAP